MGDIELLRLFALSGEFRFVVVREEVRNLLEVAWPCHEDGDPG